MKKNDNQSKPNTLYDKPTRMWFEVPADVYVSYVRECNTYRKKKQDHGLCSCPRNKWWLCDMVCMDCEFRKTDAISLDAPQGDDEDTTLMDAIPDGRTVHRPSDCKGAGPPPADLRGSDEALSN